MKKIPVIIDIDPGNGDIHATLMAIRNPKIDVKLVCSTAGNVDIDITTKNMLYFVNMFSSNIKTAKGYGKPLKRKYEGCPDVFGESGVGGFVIPKNNYKCDYEDVALAYKEVLENSKEPITIVTLGPITNLAVAITKYPEIKKHIKEVYAMIASVDGTGNVTPYAEYNCYCDPDALEEVINSGLKVTFFPKQLGENTKLLQARLKEHEVTHPMHRMIIEMLEGFTEKAVDSRYIAMYDEGAVYCLINPKPYKFITCDAEVNVTDFPGQTYLKANPNGKFRYAEAKNNDKLSELLFKELYRK